ncbi:MAG: M28 family peptidase [Bacteroidales bacterium]|jgi:hypothetical protein|nr:M28 family peptidase [Bacteroidales bacterium]MDD3273821.1 M28 family peptidase [Bacteroidales bacterium]MDD4057809.1 M28 family peptidase [Bacteroidales bacterium]
MNYFRRRSIIAIALILLSFTAIQAQYKDLERIAGSVSEERQRNLLSFLADDMMEGRASNSNGALMTLAALSHLFQTWDMIPFYSQTFIRSFSKGEFVGRNLAGVVLANGYSDKYIVISAHYDHLGMLGGKIYNGADDNASGVTALVTLANLFSQLRSSSVHLRYNIIFLLLDGKENNLIGSENFINNLPIPASKIIYNLNIDQIGTTFAPPGTNENYILLVGDRRGREMARAKSSSARRESGNLIEPDFTFYGSPSFAELFFKTSDQYNFSKKGIPSLLVTSGIHMHTYKTTDDHYFINYPVLANRTRFLFYLIYQISASY